MSRLIIGAGYKIFGSQVKPLYLEEGKLNFFFGTSRVGKTTLLLNQVDLLKADENILILDSSFRGELLSKNDNIGQKVSSINPLAGLDSSEVAELIGTLITRRENNIDGYNLHKIKDFVTIIVDIFTYIKKDITFKNLLTATSYEFLKGLLVKITPELEKRLIKYIETKDKHIFYCIVMTQYRVLLKSFTSKEFVKILDNNTSLYELRNKNIIQYSDKLTQEENELYHQLIVSSLVVSRKFSGKVFINDFQKFQRKTLLDNLKNNKVTTYYFYSDTLCFVLDRYSISEAKKLLSSASNLVFFHLVDDSAKDFVKDIFMISKKKYSCLMQGEFFLFNSSGKYFGRTKFRTSSEEYIIPRYRTYHELDI